MAAYAGIVEQVSIGAIGVHSTAILGIVHRMAVGAYARDLRPSI